MARLPAAQLPVRFGVDRLIAEPVAAGLRSARLGMVTNDATRTAGDPGVLSRVALRGAGLNLVRLFGPEHGIGARAADGEKVADARDAVTGLPVVSLYGGTHRPTREMLAGLDAVLFDIPDVGARFYTYIWTLSHVMEACAEARVPLYVLDRPNPLSGELSAAEGPMLDERRLSTFVGRWDIPVRHSLTAGELARVWNAERKIGVELQVVECGGWRRGMYWPETGLEFVPPSPNMREFEAALVYPGTCLLEGTEVSEGRGTAHPFRTVGAPWVDGRALAEELGARGLPGVRIEAMTFRPESRKFAGEECRGVMLTPTDRRAIRPVALGLHLLAAVIELHPGKLRWFPPPTAEDPQGGTHFRRLIGQGGIMEALTQDPRGAVGRIGEWTVPTGWRERVTPHLLYT